MTSISSRMKGFKRNKDNVCPVDPNTFIEALIMTNEGLGSSGVMRAGMQDWDRAAHPDGIGAVEFWKEADLKKGPTFKSRERFAIEPKKRPAKKSKKAK